MLSKDELKQMDFDNLLHPNVTLKEHGRTGPRIIVDTLTSLTAQMEREML